MNRHPRLTSLVFVGVAALALTGCQGLREAAGLTKQGPDEFAIVTKAPLIIPPDYNLKPPQPGAAPLNQGSPTAQAEATLYGTDPATVANSIQGSFSDEEKLVLAYAGAADADDTIRQQIAADNKSMQAADASFTDKLLFNTPVDNSDAPVDADAEKKRLDQMKTGTQGGQQQQPAPKKKDSGWLGGIFGIFYNQ